ncbi:hypothetical protein AX774_g242 [Zancudomyces culisetae]|uniref:Uncharacterized protein n=1 Tax=Zancudomyces culisetae TaxID=1213189 RepID=A0A1R1PZ44_ZANCU|nr:hypothetical protein AX774_g242 [Zancudomyces culisetae]|eukprot:OMH86215.1 hypothetical protein AX774_g242 [Zancudomyces culisetae]
MFAVYIFFLETVAHSSVITGVEWNSSDTKRFSSCSYDGRLRYWDITTSKCVQSFSLEFKISNHSVAQNGNHHLISANQGKSIVSKWLPKNEYALVTGG